MSLSLVCDYPSPNCFIKKLFEANRLYHLKILTNIFFGRGVFCRISKNYTFICDKYISITLQKIIVLGSTNNIRLRNRLGVALTSNYMANTIKMYEKKKGSFHTIY